MRRPERCGHTAHRAAARWQMSIVVCKCHLPPIFANCWSEGASNRVWKAHGNVWTWCVTNFQGLLRNRCRCMSTEIQFCVWDKCILIQYRIQKWMKQFRDSQKTNKYAEQFGIDGKPRKMESKMFHDPHRWRNPKRSGNSTKESATNWRKSHLHFEIQWHCLDKWKKFFKIIFVTLVIGAQLSRVLKLKKVCVRDASCAYKKEFCFHQLSKMSIDVLLEICVFGCAQILRVSLVQKRTFQKSFLRNCNSFDNVRSSVHVTHQIKNYVLYFFHLSRQISQCQHDLHFDIAFRESPHCIMHPNPTWETNFSSLMPNHQLRFRHHSLNLVADLLDVGSVRIDKKVGLMFSGFHDQRVLHVIIFDLIGVCWFLDTCLIIGLLLSVIILIVVSFPPEDDSEFAKSFKVMNVRKQSCQFCWMFQSISCLSEKIVQLP